MNFDGEGKGTEPSVVNQDPLTSSQVIRNCYITKPVVHSLESILDPTRNILENTDSKGYPKPL